VSGRLRRYRSGTGKPEKRREYRPDVLVMGADGVKKKKVRCDRTRNEPACDGTRVRTATRNGRGKIRPDANKGNTT
jgi:hypothetical protein